MAVRKIKNYRKTKKGKNNKVPNKVKRLKRKRFNKKSSSKLLKKAIKNNKNKTPIKKGYYKLIVYQKSKKLVLETYKLTKSYPKVEIFVMVPQMRRCALSVGANIVEGYSKSSKKDFARFIDISIGSVHELGFFYEISHELGYVSKEDYHRISELILEVKKLLYKFQSILRKKK